jgi:hypothetical protein
VAPLPPAGRAAGQPGAPQVTANRINRSFVRPSPSFSAAAALLIRKTLHSGVSLLTGSPGRKRISDQEDAVEKNRKESRLPLDWWTVIVAFALTALVLLGLPSIPW